MMHISWPDPLGAASMGFWISDRTILASSAVTGAAMRRTSGCRPRGGLVMPIPRALGAIAESRLGHYT
jgi:hypothetical protein